MNMMCDFFYSSLRRVEPVSFRGWRSAAFCSLFLLLAVTPGLAQGFPVTVIDSGNPPLALTVESTNDIQDVKQQILADRGYPVVDQILVYNERRLPDSSAVADHCISTNDVLFLTVDSGLPLHISDISAGAGTLEIVATQMTAGVTQIIEQAPSLQSPTVWSNAMAGLATSSGTNWTLAMPAHESAFYRIRELDPDPPITEYAGYELVWSDEFTGPGINPANWLHQLGDGSDYGLAPGWGNSELQIYTNASENSRIVTDCDGNSALLIEARQGAAPGDYTSAKLVTDGLQAFRYGRIEARIKLPYSKGAWPAFWMLGTNQTDVSWPGCGEIDIMEMVGDAEDTVHGTLYYVNEDHVTDGTTGSETLPSGLYSDDYHIYGIDWTPSNMTWSVDGVPYHTAPIDADMKEFQREFYMLLNIAVGGSWPGSPDGTSVFPMQMFVDYVRVYTDLSLVDPGEPPLDIDEETLGNFLFDGNEAIQNSFTPFQDLETITYGAPFPTSTPEGSLSSNAVDGAWSVQATWPSPTSYGGMYWKFNSNADMSAYAGGNLVFAIKLPPEVDYYLEIKLESGPLDGGPFGKVNIFNYTPVPLSGGFVEYTIPLADFTAQAFVLSDVRIPFSIWNPQSDPGAYVGGAEVLVDNVHFTAP